jgi:hypothetical protein
MTSQPASVHKCEPAKIPKTTTEKAKCEPAKIPKTTTEKATTADTTVSTATEHEELIQSIRKLIRELYRSATANNNVDAALDTLNQDLIKDKKKRESLVTARGCFILVQLLKNCLEKAIEIIPVWYRVTKISDYPELTTLYKTLNAMSNLTIRHPESRVGITANGGVETLVKIMKTFPKCHRLQEQACRALRNLTRCSIGKTKAIESGGIEVVLAAVRNHLDSATLCRKACRALSSIVSDSKENTWLLISLGGRAAVDKVSTKWPDDDNVQIQVRGLNGSIASEMKALADYD